MKTPYDGRFEILAEEYPQLLLCLLGIVKPGTKAQTIDILRELHLDPVEIDHAYRVEDETGTRIVHFEAVTSWRIRQIPRLALYRSLIKQKFELPVAGCIVVMAEKYAPQHLPERAVYEEDDGFRIETPYRLIRLWEVDPEFAFKPGSEALLQWAPLLKSGPAEIERGRYRGTRRSPEDRA